MELARQSAQLVQSLVNKFLAAGESFDDLQLDGLKIIQKKGGYKFTGDSVLLANFSKARPGDKYLDLCSGSGVVAILFSWKNKIKTSAAIELQPRLADMARRSVEANNLNINIVNDDLKNAMKHFCAGEFDVITVNPPYNLSQGEIEETEISIATHELKTSLTDICEVASKLLKFGGKLVMVHRADRLAEVIFELKKRKLEPKRLQIVYPKAQKEPNLILVEAKLGGNSGLKILPPLVMFDENNNETEALKKIYNRKS